MKLVISTLLIVAAFCLKAQDYAISSISPELKKGAGAVVREATEQFQILGKEKARYTIKRVITIYNSDFENLATFVADYDKLSKIREIEIVYYNAEGEVIEKVKNNEIEDYSATSGGTVYDDNRVKVYVPESYEYPFTVEYSYTKNIESLMFVPPFIPIWRTKMAVENSNYSVIAPKGYELRYKGLNGIGDLERKDNDSKDIYSWELTSHEAIKSEYANNALAELAPRVLIGLSSFSMEGYSGDMSSWESYGEWIAKLNNGRDKLTDEVKKQVDDLLADVDDPLEKTKILYDYMQKNTRYVSIQLGIGGFQPFSATDVINNGYGDCKALSNYMYSLLKYANVKSNYAIIKAGPYEADIETDFPSSQFNHVILAVPMDRDTVWLECTSQVSPFNFLGDFTDDRHALLVTDDGKGKLVKTPAYSAESSTQNRNMQIVVGKNGTARVKSMTVSRGVQYDQKYMLVHESIDDQRKFLLNYIDLPSFELGDFEMIESREKGEPEFIESLEIQVRNYAVSSGKRMFFQPNLLNKYNAKPPKMEDRKTPLWLRYNFIDTDSVSIKIPDGFRLEFENEPYLLNSEFGEYMVNYSFDPEENTLLYIRKLKIQAGEYPPEKYNAYRTFVRKVVRQDKSKLVLIGST